MNKAFVREPESDGRAYCPGCGSLGFPVGGVTITALTKPQSRGRLADSGWFCDFATCRVAYFDELGGRLDVDELVHPVFPKDPAAPICPCFGFSIDQIDDDVADGAPIRIRELLAKSKTPAARCETLAADGRCCIRQVQRLYMKRLGQ